MAVIFDETHFNPKLTMREKITELTRNNTCMSCHTDKAKFCDRCHDTVGVAPYCWDCHVEPRGNN